MNTLTVMNTQLIILNSQIKEEQTAFKTPAEHKLSVSLAKHLLQNENPNPNLPILTSLLEAFSSLWLFAVHPNILGAYPAGAALLG